MRLFVAFLFTFPLIAEVRSIGLKEAIGLALRENPDLLLARFQETKANLAIRVAKDPFRPKLVAGSGLAYSSGFPMSIEGAAPSIVQARAIAAILDKAESYKVAQTIEEARTAGIDTQIRRDEIVLKTAVLYLDALRWSRAGETIRSQLQSLERADELIRLRVKEGRELEIEMKRSELSLAKTRYRLESVEHERDYLEGSLAIVLGLTPADRLRAIAGDDIQSKIPDSEDSCVQAALDQSKELRRLESAILAKGHQLRSHKSGRMPTMELVAQYGLFAKFNNYEDFFRKFQRHNGQLGISLQIPLFPSSAAVAQAAQAETEINGLRTQLNRTRSRISLETKKALGDVRLAEHARELARLDLEIAREQVNILLALLEEGRAAQRQLEEARSQEQEKWFSYHDAQFATDRVKLLLLQLTGGLLSALQ
ncbi:MAG: TolC family protein [Acidobacteria bacterium]|nr:TolC family protein [Acidobacteriota bacterium]